MQPDDGAAVVGHETEGFAAVALATAGFGDVYGCEGSEIARVEVIEVDGADGATRCCLLDDETQLSGGIDVGVIALDVVVELSSREGSTG